MFDDFDTQIQIDELRSQDWETLKLDPDFQALLLQEYGPIDELD